MNVSRETQDRLSAYVALLLKWNAKINLIGRSTEADVWDRHIADSIQVFEAAPAEGLWADLGTGAGLPGLVIAILARELSPELTVELVESDARKAAFCRTVLRELDLKGNVQQGRIEQAGPMQADILSARALAPLDMLLNFAERHLKDGGIALFPKGAGWQDEVDQALASWRFAVDKIPSRTEPSAVILKIGDIARV